MLELVDVLREDLVPTGTLGLLEGRSLGASMKHGGLVVRLCLGSGKIPSRGLHVGIEIFGLHFQMVLFGGNRSATQF